MRKDGSTFQEIADALNCSLSTVHSYVTEIETRENELPDSKRLANYMKDMIQRHGLQGQFHKVYDYIHFLERETQW